MCPTEEDSGTLMSSVCIVLAVFAGKGGKGAVVEQRNIKMGQLTLGKRHARIGFTTT